MNDELFSHEAPAPAPIRRIPLSRKQRAIISYLDKNPAITLAQAAELIGGDIYANEAKHVGALLSNMVRRGLILRIKAGLFAHHPGNRLGAL